MKNMQWLFLAVGCGNTNFQESIGNVKMIPCEDVARVSYTNIYSIKFTILHEQFI